MKSGHVKRLECSSKAEPTRACLGADPDAARVVQPVQHAVRLALRRRQREAVAPGRQLVGVPCLIASEEAHYTHVKSRAQFADVSCTFLAHDF